jgi:hypothetical protein
VPVRFYKRLSLYTEPPQSERWRSPVLCFSRQHLLADFPVPFFWRS